MLLADEASERGNGPVRLDPEQSELLVPAPETLAGLDAEASPPVLEAVTTGEGTS